MTAKRCTEKAELQLPACYQLGKWDVICARGKLSQEYSGNVKMKNMIQSCLAEYCRSNDKVAKGQVVSCVIDAIKSQGGSFVKFSGDGFVLVSERFAREKVGQQFRDLLQNKNKSNTKPKKAHAQTHQVVSLMQQLPLPDISSNPFQVNGAATMMLDNSKKTTGSVSGPALFARDDDSMAAQVVLDSQCSSSCFSDANELLPRSQCSSLASPSSLQRMKPDDSFSNLAASKPHPALTSAESINILSDLEPEALASDLCNPSTIFSVDDFSWDPEC